MRNQLVIIGIGVLLVSVIFLSGCSDTEYIDQFGWDEWTIQHEAERQIKEFLKCPSTAQFSEEKVYIGMKNSSYNEYKVEGKVDAQNSFGAMIRNSFYIYLKCYADGKYIVGEWNIY